MPDFEFTVAPFAPADAGAVAELEKICFSAPWTADGILNSHKAGTLFFTAKREGVLCGYCGLQTVLDEGYLTNLAVAPECRRRGVGRALLAALCGAAEEHRLSFLTLEVRVSNTAAQALYRQAGFRPVGCRPRFYTAPAEDAILMTKEFTHENTGH